MTSRNIAANYATDVVILDRYDSHTLTTASDADGAWTAGAVDSFAIPDGLIRARTLYHRVA